VYARRVALHEVGHMFGGEHPDGGVMADGIIVSEEFTPATTARMRGARDRP
jgi:hypothetical protein